ncbi:hypothetical protein [Cupriavidus lacunae]|uniref:hypothetical protein n=1 Tax=Cupriavidus lacunae TaxID=2666307 RepID=UPI00244C3673|nr:hypothetical protein [Cupriavidus lacunae]
MAVVLEAKALLFAFRRPSSIKNAAFLAQDSKSALCFGIPLAPLNVSARSEARDAAVQAGARARLETQVAALADRLATWTPCRRSWPRRSAGPNGPRPKRRWQNCGWLHPAS